MNEVIMRHVPNESASSFAIAVANSYETGFRGKGVRLCEGIDDNGTHFLLFIRPDGGGFGCSEPDPAAFVADWRAHPGVQEVEFESGELSAQRAKDVFVMPTRFSL